MKIVQIKLRSAFWAASALPVLIACDIPGNTQEPVGLTTQAAIFGQDNRTFQFSKSAPWSAVGKILSPSGICTGTLVGPSRVITATHCFDQDQYRNPGSVTFEANVVRGTPAAVAHGTRMIRAVPGDFAFVDIDSPLGNTLGTWPIGDQNFSTNPTVNFIGYHSDLFSETAGIQIGCSITHEATDINKNLWGDCDTWPGASGGPLFSFVAAVPTIVGIFSVGNTDIYPTYTEPNANEWSPARQIRHYPQVAKDIGIGLTGAGKLQVYVSDTATNSIKSKWKTTTSSTSWFSDYVSWTTTSGVGAVAITKLLDGRQQVFFISNNTIQTSHQISVDGGWATPYAFGTPGNGLATDIAAVELADGTAQIFATTTDGNVYSVWKTSNASNAPWGAWINFGVSGSAKKVTVVRHAGGTVELFALLSDGIVKSVQRAPNGAWNNWSTFDVDPTNVDIAAARMADGRVQFYETSSEGLIWTRWKTVLGDGAAWSSWTKMGLVDLPNAPPNATLTAISVGVLPDGRQQLFGVSSHGASYERVQNSANSLSTNWSGWASF